MDRGVAALPSSVLALLAGLLIVAVLHTRSRFAGALGASIWCCGALALGVERFVLERQPGLVFCGIQTQPWLFFVAIGGVLVFNVFVIARFLRRWRASAGRGQAPTSP
jgi:hypothetical protein